MQVQVLSTLSPGSLLEGVRSSLRTADRSLMCVAFATSAGVSLVRKELEQVGTSARLLVTTTFGSTNPEALSQAVSLGVHVRVLNLSPGTYHPKLYLSQSTREASAIVGSANLTGGLVTNVEVAVRLDAKKCSGPIAEAWELGESLWSDARCFDFEPKGELRKETFSPVLYDLIEAEVQKDPVFMTLGRSPKPNRVVAMSPEGVFVETETTKRDHKTPQLVPAWMFDLAWDYLMVHGALSNRMLLGQLRVHRSSAVCAILARLPEIEWRGGATVELFHGPRRARSLAGRP